MTAFTDLFPSSEHFYAKFLFTPEGKAAWAHAYKILKPENGAEQDQDGAANLLLAAMKKWLDAQTFTQTEKDAFWDDNKDDLTESVYNALT